MKYETLRVTRWFRKQLRYPCLVHILSAREEENPYNNQPLVKQLVSVQETMTARYFDSIILPSGGAVCPSGSYVKQERNVYCNLK
jgi:hypothetical protein